MRLTSFPEQKKHKSKRDAVSLPPFFEETKQQYTLQKPQDAGSSPPGLFHFLRRESRAY